MLQSYKYSIIICMSLLMLFNSSCDDPENTYNPDSSNLFMQQFDNIPYAGDDSYYGFWGVENNKFKFIGQFQMLINNEVTSSSFDISTSDAETLDTVELWLYKGDQSNLSQPEGVKLLRGNFNINGCLMTAYADDILPTDLASATGSFEVATPSDGLDTNERVGVWFAHNIETDTPTASLELPELNDSWTYYSRVQFSNSFRLNLGDFRTPDGPDDSNEYCVSGYQPLFPGEDFFQNMPPDYNEENGLDYSVISVSIRPTFYPDLDEFRWDVLQEAFYAEDKSHVAINLRYRPNGLGKILLTR